MANKRNRKRTAGSRRDKAAKAKVERQSEIGQPNARVLAMRDLFYFVIPTKGPDGRGGSIDQDICDVIGQFCALGLLDGHGYEPRDLRDTARFFRDHYWTVMPSKLHPKVGQMERQSKGMVVDSPYTRTDAKFDAMDEALTGYERDIVFDIVVDRNWTDECPMWAHSLIAEALLQRKRVVKFMRFPTMDDRERLHALIRGLCAMHEAAIEPRLRRAA